MQLISAVVSILLARILTPDDYGKVALVTVFNNIMYVLLDCGIGTALVQKKEVDELDYSSAFFFSIVISFVLYGGMFVAAPYLAAFYNDPSMTPIFSRHQPDSGGLRHQNDPAGACDPEHEVPVFFLFRLCGRDRIHGPGPGPCLYGLWSLGAGGAAGIQYHGGHAGAVEAVLLAA